MADAAGFRGETHWDASKPDGTPQQLRDVSTLRRLGWEPPISLADGIAATIDWYPSNKATARL